VAGRNDGNAGAPAHSQAHADYPGQEEKQLNRRVFIALAVLCLGGGAIHRAAQSGRSGSGEGLRQRLDTHRNLGKAFYENPTTQAKAAEEFRKALDLAPNSARERLNYGLALLRAGKTEEGVRELVAAQKQDPSLPHTWFISASFTRRNRNTTRRFSSSSRWRSWFPTAGDALQSALYKPPAAGGCASSRRARDRPEPGGAASVVQRLQSGRPADDSAREERFSPKAAGGGGAEDRNGASSNHDVVDPAGQR
jgi:tetratricopeptide (TPR) repeat protein